MTDRNKQELIIILDRSGSMQTIKRDMEGGFQTFMSSFRERSDLGRVLVSLYQFNDHYQPVFMEMDARDVPPLWLDPSGSTSLLDAIGRTINSVGARLAARPEHERPGTVVFMIITDGEENSSHEFNRDQIRRMIEHQEQKYSWKFMYLGAGPSTFADARDYGIKTRGMYQHNSLGTYGMMRVASAGLGEYFAQSSAGVIGADLSLNAEPGVVIDQNDLDPKIKISSSLP